MKDNPTQLSAASEQLIDAVMDRYVAWREASAAVHTAYANWRAALVDRTLLFAAYQAALDREERAAGDYQQMINLAAAAA